MKRSKSYKNSIGSFFHLTSVIIRQVSITHCYSEREFFTVCFWHNSIHQSCGDSSWYNHRRKKSIPSHCV